MNPVYTYIKRLLSFGLLFVLFLLSYSYVPLYILVPVLLLAFSVLHSRITLEKPPHLFAFYRTETFFKKGGLRDLLRIVVTIFGFIYDIIIWTLWGVFLIFILFVDLIDFIRTVIYWIIHAVIWIFRQFVPFFIFLYEVIVHYLFRWSWWIYRIAWYNTRYAYNINCLKVAFSGTVQALAIIFLFYFAETMVFEISGLIFIGAVIALLPVTWSFGEIANIRANKLRKEPYSIVKSKFQNGIEAVRSMLFYITLFVVLILAQLGLNLPGWIPGSGVVIGGFMFNINTFISLLMLFTAILILFGVLIIPSYRLFTPFSETRLSHSFGLLKVIFRKFLQYSAVLIPSAVFSFFVMVLPLLVILIAGIFTFYIKNNIVDIKINNIKEERVLISNEETAYLLSKRIEHLEYLKQFPLSFPQEIKNRANTTGELLTRALRSAEEDIIRHNEETRRRISQMDDEQSRLRNIDELNLQKKQLQEESDAYNQTKRAEINRLRTDIDYLNLRGKQLPIMVLLGGLWIVIFGGLVFAFAIAYLGNIFYQVYIFRNDGQPAEWINSIHRIKAKDPKQPLLGATLTIAFVIVIYLLLISDFSGPLSRLFSRTLVF